MITLAVRFLLILVALVPLVDAQGATIWVATDGTNNSTCGGTTTECLTITYAYSTRAVAGDTIMVRDGVYASENSNSLGLRLNRDGSTNSRFTVKAENEWGAHIQGPSDSSQHSGVYIEGDYNTLDGFEVTGGYFKGVFNSGGSFNRIINNNIHSNGNDGSTASELGHDGIGASSPTSHDNLYAGNFIHDNGRASCTDAPNSGGTPCNYDHGMYVGGDNETIINNIIVRNSSHGIQIDGADGGISTNFKAFNNTISANGRGGIIMWGEMDGVEIRNNIFHNNASAGVKHFQATGDGVVFHSNVFSGNGSGGTVTINFSGATYTYTQTNTITGSPLFVNGASDWHLQSGSSAKNTGQTLSPTVTVDFDDTPRPSGGAFDIGAYEFIEGDVTAPVLSNKQPVGILSSNTTAATLSLNTNETATCKYSTSAGTAYASMTNTFSTTNSTVHSTSVSGLTNNTSYTYYVRCQDSVPNTNTSDYSIPFSVGTTNIITLDIPIALGSGDAEEEAGTIDLLSTDLEMLVDTGVPQTIGLRFPGVAISRIADITSAYVQFTAASTTSGTVAITIRGEESPNAAVFSQSALLTSRNTSENSVSWSPAAWTAGDALAAQRTPDLSVVIEEVLAHDDDYAGDNLALIISGTEATNFRRAWSFNGNSGLTPPSLHIEYKTNELNTVTFPNPPTNLSDSANAITLPNPPTNLSDSANAITLPNPPTNLSDSADALTFPEQPTGLTGP